MSTYQHNCNSDYRNEGWGLSGSGVTQCSDAWSAVGDDTKYCSNPANKGRACVKFPVDISSGSIPDGSAVESVSVWIRAKKTDGNSRSVTVNMLCTDDTSHHTQRTIYLSSDIQDYEVGTYTHDPVGKSWNKDRLDRLMLQCFSYCGSADKVRVYECYAIINYRNKPVVVVTAPSGTVTSASPTVSWTYTQADADPQKRAEYKIFTAAQQALPTFNPDVTPSVYPASSTYKVKKGDSLWAIAAAKYGDGSLWPQIYHASNLSSGNPDLIYPGEIVTIPGVAVVQGDITSFTLPFALAANDYYIYVRATSTRGARSDWASKTFTVTGSSPGVPGGGGGSLGGVGTGGGGGFETVIADPTISSVYLTVRDGSNLLSTQQADFETLTDSLGFTGSNATLTQDTTTNFGIGSGSLKMVAQSAATMQATSSYVEVNSGGQVTVRAQGLAAATGRTVNLYVNFFDDTFTSVGGTITGTGSDVTTTWTEVVATGSIPAGATQGQVVIEVVSPANAEVHNFDHIGLMYGDNAQWSNGGHASRNLLSDAASTADDPVTTEPWAAATGSAYARVANTGTGADGLKAFKMTYLGLTPTITFVATGTAYTDTTSNKSFTLNKPAGVVTGDLLVAYVASDTGGQANAPTGWSVVDYVAASGQNLGLTVLMRDALTADGSSWAGTFPSTATRKRATVVAYRGAASSALQFPQENVAASTAGSQTVQSATVSNPDSGAWRLSCFAANDNASSGAFTANITPPTTPSGISYVGKAGAWKNLNSSTSYTISRPTGVVSGDLMIAAVTVGNNVTINAPSGWTLVRRVTGNGATSMTTSVFKRTAGGSEPTSWSGTFSSSASPTVTQCVAYRNAADASLQFIAENGTGGSDASPSTPTVSNTDSKSWRISIFAADVNGSNTFTSNEVSERSDDSNGSNSGNESMSLAIYDSNGTISTGSQQRNANASNYNQINVTTAWIGIIKASTTATSPGANETERQDATAGGSNPWITLAAYDSNGTAATGSTTVYGSFGNATPVATASWLGFLIPASPTVGGEVGAILADYIDISKVSSDVIDRAGNQMTVQASFLGSTAGVPHLKMYAYTGNELKSTQVFEGDPFATDTWSKSVTQFVLPVGTTRLKIAVSAVDRQIGDYVLFDRVSLGFGTATAWRAGTGRTAHPIFNVPKIQYAEDLGDGYGDWTDLPGVSGSLLKYDGLTGLCTVLDQTIIPLSHRKYRAKTVSYGLNGDVFTSDYGPESDEVQLIAETWWLKDLQVPDNSMALKVKGSDALKWSTSDSSAVFQPLGADRPIVITEGYKGDILDLTIFLDRNDYRKLRELFNQRRTLFLQSSFDAAWWVRPNGDLDSALLPTANRNSNPIKTLDVSFVEVDPEA